MDLFINPALQFEKTSGEATLPEDPNAWSAEVLQELFKQVPYISDFEPHVVMDKVDAERGYGWGYVEVINKTEIQQGATPEGLQAAGLKQAKIPIVIKNRKLQPFDIMVDEGGKALPLTEMRLRTAIFRPSAFDITGKTPGDQSMVNQLMPPVRDNFGMGHSGTMKSASLLEAILPTINEKDYNDFNVKVAQYQAAYKKNELATKPSIDKLASWITPVHEQLEFVPSIVQICKREEGYSVKSASHEYWAPKTELIDRGQLVKTFGTKVAFEADTQGAVTMSAEPPAEPTEAIDSEKDKYEPVTGFGMYKVRTDDGKELVGYVFPNLMDVDGTPLPLCLFTNGSQKAVQGELVGIPAGTGVSLFEGPPKGTGCFYHVLGNGKAQATIPLTVVATLGGEANGGSVVLHARTFDGRELQVEVQPNLAKITSVDEQKMLVPDDMSWLPLDGAQDVALMSDPDQANESEKMASASPAYTLRIRSSGQDSYALSGLPMSKISADDRNHLSFDEALFMLGGFGVDLAHASTKLACATFGSSAVIEVQARHELTLGSEVDAADAKIASDLAAYLPDLRRDLVKEAALVPDPSAVDTVLSLGFINPENILTFVSYLPKIDESQKKLCELLLAARLGLKDLSTSPLEKAIRSTEEVISGLKVLAFQGM